MYCKRKIKKQNTKKYINLIETFCIVKSAKTLTEESDNEDLIETFCIVKTFISFIVFVFNFIFNRNILYCKNQCKMCVIFWVTDLIETFCIVKIKIVKGTSTVFFI